MTRTQRTFLAVAAAFGMWVAVAPLHPVHAEGITKVWGVVTDIQGKPLPKVKINFEAVDVKKKVGPVSTNKDGKFFIAALDISVAKKWKVIADLPGYKTVKVHYEIIDSEKQDRGSGDVILGTKQEFPDLQFALPGDVGRNLVNFVMAKEADFAAAVQAERKKKEGGETTASAGAPSGGPPATPAGATAAPGAPQTGGGRMKEGTETGGAGRAGEGGEDDKAIAAFEKANTIDPTRSESYMELAAIYEKRKDKAKAEEMYQKVIAVDPGNAAAVFYNLGVHAWNENKDKEAVQAFQKAIEIDPKYAPAHKELARVLTRLQDFHGAVQHYQEYLKLNPQAPDAKEILDTIALLKG